MTLDELEAEAMKLDLPSRTELIRRLNASLAVAAQSSPSAPPSEEERERLWLQEAMRRSRELKERQLQTEPPESGVFRPPLPAGKSRSERKGKPRPARKKPPASRPKAKSKPARARVKRGKPRPRPAKARAKPRPKPRRPRR